jgi:hypothetical protein
MPDGFQRVALNMRPVESLLNLPDRTIAGRNKSTCVVFVNPFIEIDLQPFQARIGLPQ